MTNDFLAHYGVLGMKWGVRKKRETSINKPSKYLESKTITLKNGDTFSINKKPKGGFAKFLAKINPKLLEEQEKTGFFKFERDGKTIGDATIYKESPTSLNLVWYTIKENQRGKGYGTAIIKEVKTYAKQNGFKQLTLEVPGASPDARHIYEKLGFEVGELISDPDDMWGGLTRMKLKL